MDNPMPAMYRVTKGSDLEPKATVGSTVYECVFWDFGLSAEDTDRTGHLHISVTLDPKGHYPCFTIRKDFVELMPE